MTGVIRLALFWHWQLAEKKKKERESYYRDEKQREAEKRIR